MKQWLLIIPLLGCSYLATAGGDLASSEFSGLNQYRQNHDMVAITGQHGSGNNAAINQSGSHIYGSISQVGGYNNAILNQNGFNNRAAIAQYGNGNNATVSQSGTNNSAVLVQVGSANQADVTQTGFDNSAKIVSKVMTPTY